MPDLAARIRELLAARDRARRGQLFRPDRAIEADARFVAALVELVQEYAAATTAPESARSPVRAPAPRRPRQTEGKPATGRRKPPGAAT